MTTPLKRIRINVAISTEGQKTWDATVELSEFPLPNGLIVWLHGPSETGLSPLVQAALAESDMLVAELERLYPSKEA